MNLSRIEWEEMWKSVKRIEINANLLKAPPTKQNILYEVKKLKQQIQLILGSME